MIKLKGLLKEDSQLFSEPEQLQMPPAAKEAYNTMVAVAKYFGKTMSINNYSSKIGQFWSFDLNLSPHAKLTHWITVYNDGRVELPIGRGSTLSNRKSPSKITRSDAKWLINRMLIDKKNDQELLDKLWDFRNDEVGAINWLKTLNLKK